MLVLWWLQPFYGGRLHKVTSEVKRPNGDVTCKIHGEWNQSFDFTYSAVSNDLVTLQEMLIHLVALPVLTVLEPAVTCSVIRSS